MSEAFDSPIIMEIPMEIPESLYQLNDIMVGARFEMYIAGGAVRDTILGKTPKDYDIATNASPLDVIKVLGPYVKRAEVQGEKSFAVARLIAYDGSEYEFAPYRLDSGTRSGGEAILSTKENPLSIKHDVSRRDLTINALFYRIPTSEERKRGKTGEVLDYVGGIDDIKNEVIRTVGDPEERFGEDRLRILRAFRFAGRVGGEIDGETANAIRGNNSLTEPSEAAVSSERIKEEIIKGVITSKIPSYYINMLIDFDLFPQILPGLKVSKSNSSSRNIAVQLATILIGNNHNDAAGVLFDRKFGKIIKNSVKFLLELTSLNPDNLIELKNQVTRMKRTAKSILRNEDVIDFGITIGQDFSRFVDFASAPPIMSAQDLIAGGLTPGPAIGEAMREAEIEAYFSESSPEPETVDDSDIIDEASFYNHFVKTAMIENPLDIPVPSLSGEVYIFDMDDTFFWAPEWHTIIDTNNEGDAISVDMEFPNLFYKAISFVKMVNEDHTDFIKKGKRGNYIQELIASYKEEVGELRLIREIVDLPTLGKERQVVFVLSDTFGEPVDISMLKKYFPSKHLKVFDLRGKYVEGKAVIAGDASFYQSPKTLGHVVNEEILKIYNAHSGNAIILTARETMEGMRDGIRDRIKSVGAKLPVAIFTKPTNISSGKYKAHIIGQIAQQEAVNSIEFYDDNLKYITDVNNILENVYGSEVHSKVSIHQVSILNKPEESLFARLASKDDNTNMLKKLIKIANELDKRGLMMEADSLDVIISKTAGTEEYYMDTGEFAEGTPNNSSALRAPSVYHKSNKSILNDLYDLLDSFEEYKPKTAYKDGPLGWEPSGSGGNLTICGNALSTMLAQAAKNEDQIPNEAKAMIQSLDFIKNPNKLFAIKAGLWTLKKILDPPWLKWLSPAAIVADALVDQEAKAWEVLTKIFSPHYAEIQDACPIIDAAFAAARSGVKGKAKEGIREGVKKLKGLFGKE